MGKVKQLGLLKNKMDLKQQLNEMGEKAKAASAVLNTAPSVQKNSFFDFAIKEIKSDQELILMAIIKMWLKPEMLEKMLPLLIGWS